MKNKIYPIFVFLLLILVWLWGIVLIDSFDFDMRGVVIGFLWTIVLILARRVWELSKHERMEDQKSHDASIEKEVLELKKERKN